MHLKRSRAQEVKMNYFDNVKQVALQDDRLTIEQKRLMETFARYLKVHHFSPTDDVARVLPLKRSDARIFLNEIASLGYLTRSNGCYSLINPYSQAQTIASENKSLTLRELFGIKRRYR